MLGHDRHSRPAGIGLCGMRGLTARLASVIRVDAVWLCVEPMDCPRRSSTEPAQLPVGVDTRVPEIRLMIDFREKQGPEPVLAQTLRIPVFNNKSVTPDQSVRQCSK